MKLTTKGRYAVTAMIDLALHAKVEHVRLAEIAERQELSMSYLERLFRNLKAAELVQSIRGAKGGYRLARPAKDISLAQILSAVGEQMNLACGAGASCNSLDPCLTHGIWNNLSAELFGFLDSKSLHDLARSPDVQVLATRQDVSKIGNIPVEMVRQAAYYLEIKSGQNQKQVAVKTMNEAVSPRAQAQDPELNKELRQLVKREYKEGFITDIDSDTFAPGLDEDVVRRLSERKGEPEFMLDFRLKAFRKWQKMKEPNWAQVDYPKIDFQSISYYSAPKALPQLDSLDDVDPKLLETYAKLGIPLEEQKMLANVAVDAVFDSVSVRTTFQKSLAEAGVIFMPISEAVHKHPELIKKYLTSVVPVQDNYYAALNCAVFSDGSFVYIPKGVRCPMELSTYFRINEVNTGQFERTLIVAEEGSYVSYLEGCTAPQRDVNQLHAAVVELVAHKDAEIKYSTVQNWYPGDENGKGGIYNFVTKRGICKGDNSKISWTQVETGSAITWKYPSVVMQGDNSVGEFYSVALTHNKQQADTGTKMIHMGKNTSSTIISKGISAGHGQNSYRGLVKIMKGADNARNFSQCDSLLMGDRCGAHTFPYIEVQNPTANLEHEATTSKISEDQLFYLMQRGLSEEAAVSMIVNGFCKEVFRELPMEFAVEAQKLLDISLEGAVG